MLHAGHGYDQILGYTWEQLLFAVQGILEVEQERVDTLYRTLAPLVAGGKAAEKLKNIPTARQARHRSVLEDLRQQRASSMPEAVRREMMDDVLRDLAALGIAVEEG